MREGDRTLLSRLAQWFQRLKYRGGIKIGPYPSIYFPAYTVHDFVARLAGRRQTILGARSVRSGTEIVIEGPPRSGNTFAVVAFREAQGDSSPSIAHHLHAPAQLVKAARLEIPAIGLIREPEEVALSTVLREPQRSFKDALLGYVEFYEPLERIRDEIVWAPFGDVTSDFGNIIRKVNSTYGVDFTPFLHNEENVEDCFALIEEINMREEDGKRNKIALPDKEKEVQKAKLRSELQESNAKIQDLLEKARDIYGIFTKDDSDTPCWKEV